MFMAILAKQQPKQINEYFSKHTQSKQLLNRFKLFVNDTIMGCA